MSGPRRCRVLCLRPEQDFVDVGVSVPRDLDVTYLSDESGVESLPAGLECLVLPSAGRPLAGALFDGAKDLRLVQFTGAGVDRVPPEVLRRIGAVACNVPGASAPDVAAYVVLTTGMLLRRLVVAHTLVAHGRYDGARRECVPKVVRGFRGLRVGVVGLGSIGSEVARIFHELAATPRWYDPAPASGESADRFERSDLSALLEWSEVVSIHVPLLPETMGLIGKEELALLPDGAILVNAARGGIVDETALIAALDAGRLGGAALDVYEQEPLPADAPLLVAAGRHPGRLVLTPHVAGVTREASRILFERAWGNVHAVLVDGREPEHRVI